MNQTYAFHFILSSRVYFGTKGLFVSKQNKIWKNKISGNFREKVLFSNFVNLILVLANKRLKSIRSHLKE